MRKFYALVVTLLTFAFTSVNAQIGVTVSNPGNTTPGLQSTYTSLSAALSDLNSVTAMTGPVILTLDAGASETAPATGLTIGSSSLNAVLSSGNTVTIVKASGAATVLNAGVGALTPASTTGLDGILKITGADYITIDGLTFTDGNTTNPATMEFGVGIFKLSATDGANNNTIQNCIFNMQRVNNATAGTIAVEGAVGIAVYNSIANTPNTAVTPTAASGSNSGNHFYSNTINGGNYGIAIIGYAAATPFTLADQGNDVGGTSSSTGNQILNFGGGGTNAAAGIRTLAQYSLNVQYNTVNNNNGSGVNHTGILRGIYTNTATSASETVSNNTITVKGGGTTTQLSAIENVAGSTAASNTVTISNNNITTQYATATSGVTYVIYNQSSAANVNISSNTFTVATAATSGSFYVIYNTGGVTTSLTASNNQISSVTFSGASTSLGFKGIYSSSGGSALAFTANANDITGITFTGTGTPTGQWDFVYQSVTIGSEIITNNTLTNCTFSNTGLTDLFYVSNSTLNVTITGNKVVTAFSKPNSGSSNFFGIYNFGSPGAGSNHTIAFNNFSNLTLNSSSGSTAGSSTGQHGIFWETASGATLQNVYSNKISNVTQNGTGMFHGISVAYGSTNNVYQDTVTNITSAGPVIGVYVGNSSSTTMNADSLVVNNFSSTGASASIYGVYVGGGTNTSVYKSVINTLSGSGATTPFVYGIYVSAGSTINIYRNKIYDLSESAAITGSGQVTGVALTAGTTVNMYNNLIGDLRAPAANSSEAIRGIGVTSTTTSSSYNVYYNTVYVNASSTGATFGTTGIYHAASSTATTAKLDLRNNIIINLSTPGSTSGIISVIRRSVAATYGNWATTSGNNLYYAGTPGSNRAILADVGTVYGTSAASYAFGPATTTGTFLNQVTANNTVSRESTSFTGEGFTYSTAGSFFQSVTGSSSTFLHIVAGITTQVESGALPISSPSITDDYDGDIRNASNPDVGADEFVGVTPAPAITFNSISPAASCSATAHTVSIDATTPSGTLTSVTISYNNGTAVNNVDMSSSGGNTYTYSIPAASPANTTVTWSVKATNSAGISTTYTGTSYQDAPLTGYSYTASATATSVCAGSSSNLSVVYSGTKTLGAGASTSSSTAVSFLPGGWGGAKTQYIIRASELSALGLSAGPITALGFEPTTSGQTYTGFAVNLGLTSQTTMTTSLVSTGLTQVYAGTGTNNGFTPVAGSVNTLTFGTGGTASSFTWDGTSNLLVSICWSSVPAATNSTATTMKVDAPGFTCSAYDQTDSQTPSLECATASGDGTGTSRPKFIITGNTSPTPTAYSWSDGTNVIGTTNPLTVTPATTTTYTGTVTALGCTATTNNVTVTVNSLPSAPTTSPSVQCGVGVPTVSASGGSAGQYRWYTVPTSGTAISGENNSTLSTYSISTTTTFYVAINNGTCESARTAVTATVNTPDVLTAKANSVATSTSTCLGDAISLSVVQTGSTNSYTYSWAASPTTGSGMTSGASGATALATPTATGTYVYTITGVDAGAGCTAASSVTVTVNIPVTSVSASYTGSSCIGSTITLNTTTDPGTYAAENFSEGFEGTFPPTAWTILNAGASTQTWTTSTTAHSGSGGMQYHYDISSPANAWAITPGQTLHAGTQYTISFWYKVISSSFPEKLKVTVGTNNTVAAQTTIIWNNNGGTSLINTTYAQGTTTFTPSTTGTYYFGWNCYSDPDEDILYIDDISITGAGTSLSTSPTYAWTSSPSGFTSTSQNPTTTVSQTTTYTVAVTNAYGCSKSASVDVTAIALPSAPSTTPSTQCGLGVPTASASGGTNGQYRWYLAASGGSALSGENNSTLSAYSISTTTTFYVAINNGTCESDRTPVVVTVNTPDAITAKANTVATSTSICLGANVALSVTKSGTTNTYAYSWAALPASGSGMPSGASGASNTILPTTAGTYAYTVTGVDASAGCTITSTVTVTVNANPSITSATATPSTICNGSSTILAAASIAASAGTATVGTFDNSNITTLGTPYRMGNVAGNQFRNQYLFLASELTAAGIQAGNLTSISFNITGSGGGTLSNLVIKIANTSATELTTTYLTPTFTQVFFAATYPSSGTVQTGLQTHVFSTPFTWDGTSNIVVETCSQLATTGSAGTLQTTNTAFQSTVANAATTGCTDATGTFPSSSQGMRPVVVFGAQVGNNITSDYNWVWNPGNLSGASVSASPTSSTTYTVTATKASTNCSSQATVNVTVVTVNAPVGTNSSQCGSHVPTASVSSGGGGNGTFNWYSAASGGTLLQSSTSTTYTSAVSTTTTFYVSENGSNSCESVRTPVTVTVTQPDAVTATVDNNSICLNGSIQLTATQTGSTNNYTFVWSASPASGSGISTSQSGAVINVTPTASGTYTYTVTATDGACAVTSTKSVTVKATPTNVTANYTGSACIGTTINLTSSAVSGTSSPYSLTQDLETFPPSGWTMINAGSSPNSWAASTVSHSGSGAMAYNWNGTNAANAWAITPGQTLTGGNTYTVTFWYKVISTSFPEKLKVTVGTTNTVAAQTTILWNNAGGSSLTNTTYAQGTATFTPSTTGTYYFGWNCYSDADEDVLYVDDISITGFIDATSSYAWTSNPGGFTSSAQNPTGITVSQTTTYTVTVTNANSCSASADVLVTAHAVPSAPTTSNSSQCGTGVPTASASGGSAGQYRWYTVASGGTAIAGETNSTLSSYTVSNTTTLYVAINNGFCEGSRTAVTVNVSHADPVGIIVDNASICPNDDLKLTADQQGTGTSNYTFTWTASPVSGSGMPTAIDGDVVIVNPTTPGTYTYTLTAHDAGANCTEVATQVITVNTPPSITSVTATPSAICLGGSSVLKGSSIVSNAVTATIGTQASTSITPSPYRGGSGSDCRNQFLYTAAELTAAGFHAGYISGIGFNCTSAPSTAVPSLTIQIGSTSATSLGTTFLTDAVSTIYGPTNFIPVTGLNTHTFSTPFYWNGTSSILINTCSPGGGGSSYNVSIGSVAGRTIQSATSGACTATTGTSYNQVVATFIQSSDDQTSSYTWSWTPTTGLSAATGSTVTATPTTSGVKTYNVTATNPTTGCSSSQDVSLTVNAVPATPTGQNSTQCGVGVPTASVTGSGGTLKWYSASTGGTLLQTGGSTYTSSISSTTTFYVGESNGNCESPRVAVTAAVTTPPTISTSGTATICEGSSTTIGASSTNSGYSYTWNPGNLSGASVLVSPTTTTTYTVIASDNSGGSNNGCSTTGSVTITVNPRPLNTLAVTPSSATICSGNSQTLTASGGGITSAIIGTGTVQNAVSSTTNMPPYGNYYTGNRHQILILASELTAMGMVNGSVINSLAFDVVSNTNALKYQGFYIRLGHTGATALTTTFLTDATTEVYSSALFDPTVGWSTHNFSQTFTWNGTSNLLVETYFSNCGITSGSSCSGTTCTGTGSGTTYTQNAVTNQTTTAFVSHAFYYADGTGCSPQTQTTASSAVSVRPNIKLGIAGPTWSWSPSTGLNTTTGTTVIASPTSTTTYTATAAMSTGCSRAVTVTVTVNQPSVAPTGASSSATNICYSTGNITLTKSGGSLGTGASWKWYSNSSLTALVGTSSDPINGTLVIANPSATTTYYVRAEGTASPCTPTNTTAASVTVTVSQPSVAPTAALASGVPALTVCTGGSAILTQSGGTLGTGASWKWYSDAGFTQLVQSSGNPDAAITVLPSATTTYYVRAEGTTSPCTGTTAAQSVTVTVNTASVAPTGATTTSTLVCVSTSITLRQTGGTLGTGASWKWYSDASYTTLVGTSTAPDASLTVFPSGNTTYYVRAEGSAPCTPAITASASVSVTANNNNTWIGANNVWDNPANWTCGIVPNGTAADAYIPANASFPVLTSDITLRNIYIQSTTTDVNLNGHTLTLTGGVVGSGYLRGSTTSGLVLSGAAGTVRLNTAYGTLKDLTLTSGASATLGNPVAIYGTVTVGSGAVLNTAGLMTLKSNYAVTARVATSPGTITGNVTVERYIPGNAFQAWRLLSVPTQGTQTFRQAWQENQAPLVVGTPGYGTLIGHYAGTGFDYVSTPTGNSSLKTWNSTTGTWDVTVNSTATQMQTKSGYLLYIKGDRTITPSMSTNTTSSTILRTTGTLYQGNQTSSTVSAGKYAVIGNVYASPIDFTALTKDTSSTGLYNTFYVWDPKLYGTSGAGGYQTFAKANGWVPTPGGGSYGHNVPNTTIEQGQAFMVIARSGGSGAIGFTEAAKVAGGANVFIRTAATNRLTATLSLKGHADPADGNVVVFGAGYTENIPKAINVDESFAIATGDESTSVSARASAAKEGDRVTYAIGNMKPGQEYVLEFNTENFNGQEAYLEDSYLHTSTPVNMDGKTTISFTTDQNAASSAKGRFTVVFGKTVSAPAITIGAGKITVAPNPVTGRTVSLQFSNKAEGAYKVTFTNTAGQNVFTTTVNHTGNSSTQRINLPKQAQGVYNMQIIAPDGKKENQRVMVN